MGPQKLGICHRIWSFWMKKYDLRGNVDYFEKKRKIWDEIQKVNMLLGTENENEMEKAN